MEIALQAVRVYGSKSQYGSSPRLCPTDGCLALEGYPRPGERCVVLLGAPSESVLRANQVRRAIGYVLLSGHFGQAPDPEAERDLLIGKALDEGPTPSASDYNWYVTLVLERRVSVADGSVADRRYLWLDFGEAMRLESELLTYARPQIDLLATCVSTVLGKIFFHVVALEDRVFFSAPGRESFGLPEFSFPRMTVNMSGGSADTGRLRQLLQGVASLPQGERLWLKSANYWYLAALGERDSWKRFLSSYFAMEILTNKLVEKLYDHVVAGLRLEGYERSALKTAIGRIVVPREQLTLAGKFAIVALGLFPDSATQDLMDFQKMNRIRNRLAHGDASEERHLGTLVGLLDKYMAAAMQFHVARQAGQG